MATYYVDPSRTTNGVGSEADPFNSWANLDAAVTATANDVYLQRSGTTARENIPSSVVSANNITLGVYGGSNYARVTGFNVLSSGWSWNATYMLWQNTIANAWIAQADGEPLRFIPWTTNIANTAPLMTDKSFTYSGSILYVKGVDPTSVQIEASARQYVIGNTGSGFGPLKIEGFSLDGAYRHGIFIGNKPGLVIRECYFGMTGGELATFYIGNHIEMYDNNVNVLIEDCVFDHAFDSSISVQHAGTGVTAQAHQYRRNIIRRAGFAGIEAATNNVNQSILGVLAHSNTITDCGYGWSGNRGGRGVTIQGNNLSDPTSIMTGMAFVQNTIRNCRSGALFRDTQGSNVFSGNLVQNCLYGFVARQAIAGPHVDTVAGNVFDGVTNEAFFVSGANDGIHGSGTATEALTVTATNNTVTNAASGTVNTTNANATVTHRNSVFTGCGTVFNHSVGALTESYNCVFGNTTIGKALDGTDLTADPQLRSDGSIPASSPCATAGTYVAGVTLANGRLRPGYVPIGAYMAVLPRTART